MTARMRTGITIACGLVGLLVYAGFAWVAIPNDPWVLVDRAKATHEAHYETITKRDPFAMRVRVPEIGLDRIDLQMRLVRDLHHDEHATLRLQLLDASNGEQIWTSDLDANLVEDERMSELFFGRVSRDQARAVELRITPIDLPRDVKLQILNSGCRCMPSVSVDGWRSDPVAATWTNVPSNTERMTIARDRIDALRPAGWGATMLILMGGIAVALVFGLLGYVSTAAEPDDAEPLLESKRRRQW